MALAEQPVLKRSSRFSYGGGAHEFSRALSLVALLSLSNELTQLFNEDKTQVFKALMIVASCTFLVDACLLAVQGLSHNGPKWCAALFRRFQNWFAARMGLPPAFDPAQLLVWQKICAQLVKNFSVDASQTTRNAQQANVQWDYQKRRTIRMLHYMVEYFSGHEHYYRAHRQRGKQQDVSLLGYAGNNADHICFFIEVVVADMKHVAAQLEQAEAAEALDREHVASLCASVLHTMHQLYAMIAGEDACKKETFLIDGIGYR